MHTLEIYKLGFNQNCHTFTLILLIKIVLCSKSLVGDEFDLFRFEIRLCNPRNGETPGFDSSHLAGPAGEGGVMPPQAPLEECFPSLPAGKALSPRVSYKICAMLQGEREEGE